MKKKRILYVFYHCMAFGWVILHRMNVHKEYDADLLVGNHTMYEPGWGESGRTLAIFQKRGFFSNIYTFNAWLGVDKSKYNTLEKVEEDIFLNLERIINVQNIKLEEYDAIYSHTDGFDPVGFYLSAKHIPFYWFEGFPNYIGNVIRNENGIKRSALYPSEVIPYAKAVYKYKTLLGECPYQKLILFPESYKSKALFSSSRYTIFDPYTAADNIDDETKKTIIELLGLKEFEVSDDEVLVIAQSDYYPNIYRGANPRLTQKQEKSKIKNYRFYYLQMLMDYFIPKSKSPVLKTHPNIPVSNVERNGFFNGVKYINNFFSVLLMELIKTKINPSYYVVTWSSAGLSIKQEKNKISCLGVVLCPQFYDKYFIILQFLSNMKVITSDLPTLFMDVELSMDGLKYNDSFKKDISSLLSIHFAKDIRKEQNLKYCIQQEKYNIKLEKELVKENDFVVYLDLWNELTCDEFELILPICNVTIIKIIKTRLKEDEYILSSICDEYIYIMSMKEKNIQSYDFNYIRKNLYSGVKIIATEITVEQYLWEMKNKEKDNDREEIEIEYNLLRDKVNNMVSRNDYDLLKKQIHNMVNKSDIIVSRNEVQELIWRQRYKDVEKTISWCKDVFLLKVSYSYLYMIVCIAYTIQPKNVLEFGCSEYSKVLGNYAQHNNAKHTILEYHKEYAQKFVKKNNLFLSHSSIFGNELDVKCIDGDKYYSYRAAESVLKDKKFDFILLKKPYMHKDFPVVDLLSNMDKCVSDTFVILIDGVNWPTEQRLLTAMKKELDEKGISYGHNVIAADTAYAVAVLFSENIRNDLQFIC